MTAPSRPSQARPALSRDLSEFLIELSIALHKHAIYPEGHPSLAPAAAGVARRADYLLGDRPSLSVGVARHQLIIEGVATDPKHPVLGELAERLHRHHLGAMTVYRGATASEIADVLKTIAVEPDRSGKPLGLGDPARLQAWPHVRLHPLTYERLELIDSGDAAADGTPEDRDRVRSAQLWLGLARAALAGQTKEGENVPTTPAVIAEAIDAAPKVEGYDQVIVGYLLQIAEELKAAGGSGAVDLRRRTSRLIRAMRPDTLRRLLQMGGDFAQRRQFVLDATHGVAVDAVIELVRAAADASQQTVSHSLVRMLSKLAAHAERGEVGIRANADAALRDQVERLLRGWTLDDPNPGAYGRALQAMARTAPALARPADERFGAEDERLVQMALELDETGPWLQEIIVRLRDAGQLSGILGPLEQAPDSSEAARTVGNVIASVETLEVLLGQDPVDFQVVDRVVARLGYVAAEPLLDALTVAEHRGLRRNLLERLAAFGAAVGPLMVSRLADDRWYVRRNLLQLLGRLPSLPDGFSPAPYVADPDPRVRSEAIRLQLTMPAEVPQGIIAALQEKDEPTLRRALAALLERPECLPPVLQWVIAFALDESLASGLRVPAIRCLAGTNAPEALETLLRIAELRRGPFRRSRLPPTTLELAAAVAALAERWPTEPRASAVLERASASGDPLLKAALKR